MISAPPDSCRRAAGFTLVESIVVIVALAIAAVAIINLQTGIFSKQEVNRDIQVGQKLMQECAEKLLAIRRRSSDGFADVRISATPDAIPPKTASENASAQCASMVSSGLTAPTVTVTSNLGGDFGTSCPFSTDNTCKRIEVSQGGLAPIQLMLIKY